MENIHKLSSLIFPRTNHLKNNISDNIGKNLLAD